MYIRNSKFYAIATYSDGSMSECRFFCTENALSNWANKQYKKDNDVTVNVWDAKTDKPYCTYHA